MHEQPTSRAAETIDIDLAQESAVPLLRAIETSPPAEAPRIWVGSIEDYLDGAPYGRWLEAARHPDELAADIDVVLQGAPTAKRAGARPHWGIFAAQGFGQHQPSPDDSLAEITRRAHAIRDDGRAFAAWAGLQDGDAAHAARFNHAYQGRFGSFTAWLNLQVEQAGWDRLLQERLPPKIQPFVEINLDALGHDLLASGEVVVVPNERQTSVWIFDTRDPAESRGT